MKIAVLGSGPAGMMAAWAAIQAGHTPQIITNSGPSQLHGAQYLHRPIPGFGSRIPSADIEHVFLGTIEGYRRKVYGTEWEGIVSPEQFDGKVKAWDIRFVYSTISGGLGQHVELQNVKPSDMQNLIDSYDRVVSTIPRHITCGNPDHQFKSAMIYAMGGSRVTFDFQPNSVVCSGLEETSWYRTANIFGHTTVEWAAIGRPMPPYDNVKPVFKPTSHNCNCWPDAKFTGRYGAWRKGVLTHHAYEEVAEWLEN